MAKRRSARPPTVSEMVESAQYPALEHIAAKAFATMTPAEHLTVAECAEKYMRFGSGSGHTTPWSPRKTPYLIEPMNVLTSLDYKGMIFVGPARTGKTALSLAWLAHTVITDPADMLYVQMDREGARKFSAGDLDRFLQASPEVRRRQLTARQDDNVFDKHFDSGMRFLLTYPTASNLSGITVGKVWMIDYERMPDSVDGEGTPFDMAQKRTQTFGRYGMTVAEASPNPDKEITDPKWIAKTPHEAPPIRGIFELYNRGDRRRLFWTCPQCAESFEPDFKLLKWVQSDDIMESARSVYMECPANGCVLHHGAKDAMNADAVWVPDGGMLVDGKIVPRPGMKIAHSSLVSFWMKGPASGYMDWNELVEKYLRALKALEETGDDGPLKTTITTDQGSYYIAASRMSERSPEELKAKAEDWGSTEENPTVPHGVRFLTGTVDVQSKAFVVQINGYHANGDITVIDSYKLRLANRRNSDGDRLPMDPFAFGEDWDCLLDGVLHRSYPLADESGRRMKIRAVGCDSGGGQGATANAYNFWRRLKKTSDGLHRKFVLLKGEPHRSAPRAATRWPDSSQKDKHAIARGDVPVLFLNSNPLKSQLSGMMARRVSEEIEGGEKGGMLRFPDWMPDWFYKQITTEILTEKGWTNPAKRRNEAFDLSYYAIGLVIRPVEQTVPFINFQMERIDWNNPKPWCADWDDNELVFSTKAEGAAETTPKRRRSFAEIAADLA